MTIFVLGGSNSLRQGGWTTTFGDMTGADVVNLSVGATTSVLGAVRLRLAEEVQTGDTVVWEYAINDVNHLARNYPLEALLRFVEHTLRECADRGVRMIPVVLRPRWLEPLHATSLLRNPRWVWAPPLWRQYHSSLRRLFDRYNLDTFDFTDRYRSRTGKAHVVKEDFEDGAHIRRGDELMRMIAEGVAERLPGRVPQAQRERYTAGKSFWIHERYCEESFENRILRVPITTLPRSIEIPAAHEGTSVTGILALTHPMGGALRLEWPGAAGKVSLSNRKKGFGKHTFKLLLLEYLLGEAPRLRTGEKLDLSWAETPGEYPSEYQMRSKLGAKALGSREARVGGLLLEGQVPYSHRE